MTTETTTRISSREHWLAALDDGGPTRVPRWAAEPGVGVGTVERVVPDDLQHDLNRLAMRHAVPLGTLVLAAHVKVLAALSGERDVTTGYVAVPRATPAQARVSIAALPIS